MQLIGLAAMLTILLALPAQAQVASCEDYTPEELQAMSLTKLADWLIVEEVLARSLGAQDRATIYLDSGNAYLALHDYELAIDEYNKAIALAPNLELALANRATAYLATAFCLAKPRCMSKSLANLLEAIELKIVMSERIQTIMAGAGFYDGPIDGAFGPESHQAWMRWCAAR